MSSSGTSLHPFSAPMPDVGRWVTPPRVLTVVLALVIALVLFAPAQSGVAGNFRLTTYASDPTGAQGVYDIASVLGWPVTRRTTPLLGALDTTTTYAVLAPPVGLTASEINVLMTGVRNGARVLVAAPSDALADSVGVKIKPMFTSIMPLQLTSVAGGTSRQKTPAHGVAYIVSSTVVLSHPSAVPLQIFMWASPQQRDSATAPPLIVGRTFGRGKIVVVGDADLLRNDVLREEPPGIAVVRALQWLSPNRGPLVFDEYHQGFGMHASVMRALGTVLTQTPPGRVALQGIVAALVLLLAVGARAIAPTARQTIERRSPLEHVSALAQAYEQIHATRLGAERLLRGLRRRNPLGVSRAVNDDAYLAALRARFPGAAADVAVLAHATRHVVPKDDFTNVGAAVSHIERTIRT